jgi:hypothetical protein
MLHLDRYGRRGLHTNTLIPLRRLHELAFGCGTSAYAEDRASLPPRRFAQETPTPALLRDAGLIDGSGRSATCHEEPSSPISWRQHCRSVLTLTHPTCIVSHGSRTGTGLFCQTASDPRRWSVEFWEHDDLLHCCGKCLASNSSKIFGTFMIVSVNLQSRTSVQNFAHSTHTARAIRTIAATSFKTTSDW